MSVDSAVVEVLSAAAPALQRSSSRWYLFGAQAVAVWGRPRMSADVDITAALATSSDQLVEAMKDAGFALRLDDWRTFLARTRVLPFFHRATGLPLDIVIAGPGLEEDFLSRVRHVDLAGLRVPVLSPEDLIVTKLLAGRPKDVEDVRSVLDERLSDLDLDRIHRLIELLEQALTRSDISSVFEGLLRSARRA